jgi:hypothetical protein
MLSLLPDKSAEEMIEELHGRIYYNPLVGGYETSDRFIAGNVVEKTEAFEQYLKDNPQDNRNPETAERGQSGRKKRHEFFGIRRHIVGKYRPAGESKTGKEGCRT